MGQESSISLDYQTADKDLATVVSSFYRFSFTGDNMQELERADRAQFRFSLSKNGKYLFDGGHEQQSYDVTILGPTTAPVISQSSGPTIVVGWGLLPAGWASLMGKDSEKWVDDAMDATLIFGNKLLDVREQLMQVQDDNDSLFAILQQAARDIFSHIEKAPLEFTSIVDNWLMEDTEHNIDALVRIVGLSQRQLERMAKRYYGLPPRKLARKYRALRAAHILAAGDSLDDSELGLSFYDQSHLVREIKQFTGLTPTELRKGKAELTQATIMGRKSMSGKVSKLVSDS